MLKKMKFLMFLVFSSSILVLSGCAVTLPTNSYTPQNFVRKTGSVDMGTFTYIPYIQGMVKKPNQIQNTAAGSMYISMDVSDFVKRGTALELEKSGISLNPASPIKLDGNVLEFKADDLGYSVDWSYKIQYKLVQRSDSTVLFDKTFAPAPKKTGKFGLPLDYANIAAECVLAGYDLFIRDPHAARILETNESQPVLDKKSFVPITGKN